MSWSKDRKKNFRTQYDVASKLVWVCLDANDTHTYVLVFAIGDVH